MIEGKKVSPHGMPSDDAAGPLRPLADMLARALAAIAFASAPMATAQPVSDDDQRAPDAPADRVARLPERGTFDDLATGRHTGAIMLGTSAALALYGKRKWWRDGFQGRLKSVDEGWFGARTYSGGADKLGHFYMTYASSRLLTKAFVWDGAGHEKSLQIAAWYTLGAYAAIEVLDGFSRKWSFSREDMLMNAAGVGTAVLLERHPELDRKFDLRLLYRPSHEDGRGFDPFGDYSGQTYLVVAKLAGFPAMRDMGLLRYVEIAAGYGTRGFDHDSGTGSVRHGKRNIYVGLSLNLSELLVRARTGEEGRAQRWARTTLEYVQLPGTALLSRHTLRPDQSDSGQREGQAAGP